MITTRATRKPEDGCSAHRVTHLRAAADKVGRIPLARELPEVFADRFCGRVVRGVERIAEWAKQEPRPLDIPSDAGMLVTAAGT